MGTRRKKEICIYCNLNPSTSNGDHIPPVGFFKKPRGYSLVQVPCCYDCNQIFSKLDQDVRNLIGSLEENQNHSIVQDEIQSRIRRDFEEEGRVNRFVNKYVDLDSIQKAAILNPLKPPNEMSEAEIKAFEIPLQVGPDFRTFMTRMARALLFASYKKRVSDNVHCEVYLEKTDNKTLSHLRSVGQTGEIGNGDFRWTVFWNKPYGTVIYWMQFYNGFEVIGVLGSEELVFEATNGDVVKENNLS